MALSNADMLATSASRYGYNLDLRNFPFRDFRQFKIDFLSEYFANITTEYAMYTDALDSWFLRPDILKVYKRYYKDKIVVSANRDHYPVTDLYVATEESFPSITSLRFTCSSQFIGRSKDLAAFLEKMKTAYAGLTDQEGWHVMRAHKVADFEIDNKCRLFMNMTGIKKEEITDDWRFTETKTKPCSIHFGGAKGGDPNAQLMSYFYDKWLHN